MEDYTKTPAPTNGYYQQQHKRTTRSTRTHTASTTTTTTQRQRLLHTPLGNPKNAPPDLIQYILQTRPNEVSQKDEQGNLPLHIAAATTPFHSPSSSSSSPKHNHKNNNTEAGDYYSKSVIEKLLSAYPHGAACVDRDGKLPLQLGIESGKHWSRGGVKSLYGVFPEAMTNVVVVEECPPGIPKDDDCVLSLAGWQNCVTN